MKKIGFLVFLLFALFLCSCGHEHEFIEDVVKEGNCYEKGLIIKTCASCDYFEEIVTDEVHEIEEFSCYNTEVCIRCFQTFGEPLSHDFVDATCTEAKTCKKCYTTEGEPLGHDYVEVVTAPTCLERGYSTWTCSRCEASYVDQYKQALGHDFNEENCNNCGSKTIKSITLNYTELVMEIGEEIQLEVTFDPVDATDLLKWERSSSIFSAVVTCGDGLVKAHRPGKDTVTVTTSNGLTATCTVTVNAIKSKVNFYVNGSLLKTVATEGAIDASKVKGLKYCYEWYTDEDCTKKFDFNSVIIEETNVYGKRLDDIDIIKSYLTKEGSVILFTSSNVNYILSYKNGEFKVTGFKSATYTSIGINISITFTQGGQLSFTYKPSITDDSTQIIGFFTAMDFEGGSCKWEWRSELGDSSLFSTMESMVKSVISNTFNRLDDLVDAIENQ